jgi:GT2 family glycosyltransferase/LmbE family N-acetylglucosaminyl deacetylase
MIEEHHLTTFETSTLPGNQWLIFAPHADDESIGMGGTIIDAISRGIKITLVVMTNGAYGKKQDQKRSEIIALREQEVKKVVSFLGIQSVIFLAEEDRGLSLNKQSIHLIAEKISACHPDSLFIPSALELHPDHRMTSELVWQAIKQVNYKGNTFSYDISIQSPISHLVDISHCYKQKKEAILLYPSQVEQNNYIDIAFALNKARTYTLPAEVEYAEAFKQLFPQKYDSFSVSSFSCLQAYWETIPFPQLTEKDKLCLALQQQQVILIIVNYNSGNLLLECIEALEKQRFLPTKVIIVDNASSDTSMDHAHSSILNLQLINLSDNAGFAKANNIALEAIGDSVYNHYVALLNPDAFPEPEWLEELLISATQNPEYSFFASNMLAASENSRDNKNQLIDGQGDEYHFSGLVWRHKHGHKYISDSRCEKSREIFSACAGAALYRTQDIKNVGGFDEDFFCYSEDIDLCFRLLVNGKKGIYVPKAVVFHIGSAITGKRSDFSLYYGHRNLVWTYFKNMPLFLLIITLPAHLALNIFTLVYFSVKGHGKLILRAKIDAIKGLPKMLKKRAIIQKNNNLCSAYLFSLLNKSLKK